MFESFCAKYSHTFDRLLFVIFSVKRLMFAFCLCLPALHCHKTVAMKTPMSVSDTEQSLHWELGQFYMCPTDSDWRPCSIGSGTEIKRRNLRCISVRVGTGCIGTGSILVPVLGTQPYSSAPPLWQRLLRASSLS